MKTCALCKKSKPLSDFYHYNGRAISYCRPCNTIYHRGRQKLTKSERSIKLTDLPLKAQCSRCGKIQVRDEFPKDEQFKASPCCSTCLSERSLNKYISESN